MISLSTTSDNQIFAIIEIIKKLFLTLIIIIITLTFDINNFVK